MSEETLDDFIKRLQEKQTDLEIKKKEVQGKINDLRVEIGKLETALESAEKILENNDYDLALIENCLEGISDQLDNAKEPRNDDTR